ncbi:MAG: SDR family oxidoreductase [Anaerolineae bacterium]|nr:SDR family oxidoreductase [Anaerolineae bacterium]
MRLKDRVALITGAAAGIGKATAELFHREGAQVVICDVNEQAGQTLAETLGNAAFYKVNVADRQEVQAWIDDVIARHARVDVLINNAGITRDALFVRVKDGELVKQMPEEDFDLVVSINLKGVFNCTQAVAPYMIKQSSGSIVSVSSVVGLYGNFGQTNYAATKAGVIGMTKVWARELGRYGVRVNAVAPGFTLTEMVQKMPEQILDRMKAQTPLGRLAQPIEIANVFLWLASDESSFVHGATISVDGGMILGT